MKKITYPVIILALLIMPILTLLNSHNVFATPPAETEALPEGFLLSKTEIIDFMNENHSGWNTGNYGYTMFSNEGAYPNGVYLTSCSLSGGNYGIAARGYPVVFGGTGTDIVVLNACNGATNGHRVFFPFDNGTIVPSFYEDNEGLSLDSMFSGHLYDYGGNYHYITAQDITNDGSPAWGYKSAWAEDEIIITPEGPAVVNPSMINLVIGVQGNNVTFTALATPGSETSTIDRFMFWFDMADPIPDPIPDPDFIGLPSSNPPNNIHLTTGSSVTYGTYRDIIEHAFPDTTTGTHTAYVTAFDSTGGSITTHYSYTLGTFTAVGTTNTGPADIPCGDWDFGCIITKALAYIFIPDGAEISNAFTDFNTNNFNIGEIITLPLTTLGSLANASCETIDLTLPFINHAMTLPCYGPIFAENFGGFWTVYQVILTGSVAYLVAINSIALAKRIKDPDDDKIEVFHL